MIYFVKEKDNVIDIDTKRQYLPKEMYAFCPQCKKKVYWSGGYIRYPEYYEEIEIPFYHDEHEWKETIILETICIVSNIEE